MSTVRRIAEARLPTDFGDFKIIGYRSLISAEEFITLVKGTPRPQSSKPHPHPFALTLQDQGALASCISEGKLPFGGVAILYSGSSMYPFASSLNTTGH